MLLQKVKIQRGDGYGEPIGATIVDQLECDGCGPSDLGEWRNISTSAYFRSLKFLWQGCPLLCG
jgi:hypothetical protein